MIYRLTDRKATLLAAKAPDSATAGLYIAAPALKTAGLSGANFWPPGASLLHPVGVNPRFRQLLPASLLLLAATSVPLLIWSPTGLARLEALEQQRKGLQLEVQRLEREID